MADRRLQTTEVSDQYCIFGSHSLFKLKRYEDALFYFDEAIRYNFLNEEARFNKILTLMRLERDKEAIAECDMLLEINPYHVNAYKQKALALASPERARKVFELIDTAIASFEKRIGIVSSQAERTELQTGIKQLSQLRQEVEHVFKTEPHISLVRNTITKEPISISLKNLQSSTYICGVQGSGKTSILTHTALEMIDLGESVIVLDPSGDMCHDIMHRLPKNKVEKTYYLSLTFFKFPFSLNLFSYPNPGSVGFEAINAARNQIYMAFSKIFGEGAEGVYFKGILRNLIPLLLDHPNFTIFHVEDFLADAGMRKRVLQDISDKRVNQFWERFDKLPEIKRQEEAGPFLRRLEELLDDPVIANHIGQKQGKLDIKRAIENKEILLIHLPLDLMPYRNAAPIIGTLLMMQIYAATFSFVGKRPGFTLLVDEAPEFLYAAGEEFKKLLELGRKYGIRQVLCHQNTGQFAEEQADSLRDALTSSYVNIVMRTTLKDSGNFAPLFTGLQQYPAEIEIEVLDKLKYHKSFVVKEFWQHVVRPLQEKLEIAKQEQRHVGTFSREIEPFSSLLEQIHNLLYFSQKRGQIDERLRAEFVTAYTEYSEEKSIRTMFVDKREKKQQIIRTLQKAIAEKQEILTGYEKLIDKIDQGYWPDGMEDIDGRWVDTSKQRANFIVSVLSVKNDELPELYNKLKKAKDLPDFAWEDVEVPGESTIATIVNAVLNELIKEPLTAGGKLELPIDEIAKKLKGMKQRHGLAKIQGNVYEIETIDLPPVNSTQKEITARLGEIIAQTKRKYCRGKAEVEAEIQQLQVKLNKEVPQHGSTHILRKLADDIRQQPDRLDEFDTRTDY